MKRNIIYILLSLCAMMLFNSCEDDFYYDGEIIGEGEGQLSATVAFHPLVGVLDESRATAGNALKKIRNLTVIVYQKKGEHFEFYKLYQDSDLKNLELNLENDDLKPDDIDKSHGEHFAETKPARATFDLPGIPFGHYKIYVAANLTNPLKETDVTTPDDLKKITQSWNAKNIAANDQMFGYFTPDTDNERSSAGFEARTIVVNKKAITIHAWMKRLASKVTIAYDPSGLKQSIWIYIHKATIKDIPLTCPLGQDNKPTKADQISADGEDIIYGADGSILTEDKFPENKDFKNWMELDMSSGIRGSDHSENAQALYFYENMQGDFDGEKKYDKTPDKNDVYADQTEGKPGYKDNVSYGTYIEVEGFYISQNPSNQSSGPIKYRFMLGKNTTYNYDAQRNHHYKLTLKFKGYANQPEWHIDYEEEDPDIFPPEYFYVPYLYNHKVYFPLRVVGNCTSLKAQIVENNWAPYDSTTTGTYQVPPETVETNDPNTPFRWNEEVFMNNTPGLDFYYGLRDGTKYTDVFTEAERKEIYKGGRKVTPIWAGFLALQVPKEYENGTLSQLPTNIMNENGSSAENTSKNKYNWYSSTHSMEGLKNYFLGNGGYINDINNTPQHEMTYETSDGAHGNGLNGYYVGENEDKSHTYMIPMFTRPKAMIFISGFTGNNPYEAYQRKAVVRFTATFLKTDGTTVTKWKEVPVYQVRRLVNPKGVWHKYDNDIPFHVTLMKQSSPSDINYTPIESYGSWKAYIKSCSNAGHFSLTSTVGKQIGDTIYGDTGTNIDFDIKFGKITKGDTECALVNVEYHGNTCQHTIFVRQGYNKAIEVNPGGAKWSSFSVYSFESGEYCQAKGTVDATLTVNPLTMGTMFKRGNYMQGILIENDKTYGPLVPLTDKLKLTNDGPEYWANIKGNITRNNTFSWCDFKAKVGDEMRLYSVPTYEEFAPLLNENFGYGVLYTDGATGPATTTTNAFQFFDYENKTTSTEQGMRGVFVYHEANAHQVFFPIGAYGIGRRTNQNTSNNEKGYLRYGAVANVLKYSANTEYNQYRPIPYNLPASPGSIYWTKTNKGDLVGWDMNYFDMSFNAYDNALLFGDYGDAVLIKPVYKGDVTETK